MTRPEDRYGYNRFVSSLTLTAWPGVETLRAVAQRACHESYLAHWIMRRNLEQRGLGWPP